MSYKNIPFGSVEAFNVVIEIPKGSANKYEYDEELDAIRLDWVFHNGFNFILDYGYIPETRGGDGDHLDVFIFASSPLTLGTIVKCRVIGMIETLDRGETDDKFLAVPMADPESNKYRDLNDLPFDYRSIFEEFFKELALQKKKTVEIKGFRDKAVAIKELDLGHKNFTQS